MNLTKYKTLIFDCDGVILNSNGVKAEAFYQAALPYGETVAAAFVNYHVANGGVSRYRKFEYLLDTLLTDIDAKKTLRNKSQYNKAKGSLLAHYAAIVALGLKECDVAEGLHQLRGKTSQTRWLVVSGGDQDELREIFRERGIEHLFDGGIFGSPDTKDAILSRETENKNIGRPALFIGDSQYDYIASRNAGLDFMFLRGWSEWQPSEEWVQKEGMYTALFLRDLLDE